MKKRIFAKTISLISALAMIIVLAMPVFAADSVKLSQTAEISGKTVVVKIGISENSGLATFSATLSYDAAMLEFSSIEYTAGNTNATNTKEDGKVGINMVWAEAMSSKATLATIVFNIKPGAEGEIKLPVSVDFATDKQDANISVTPSTAGLNIPKGIVPATTAVGGTEESVKAKNPNTSGTAMKVGGAAAVVIAAAAVGTLVAIKKKKES